MTVRTRTRLVAVGSVIVLTLLAAAVGSQVILERFAALERQQMREDVERVEQAVDREVERLARSAEHWATWDDSYRFAQDHNADYESANLLPEALASLSVTFLGIVDADGEVAAALALDEDGETVDPPAELLAELEPDGVLVGHDTTSSTIRGVLDLDVGATLIASRPILTSAGEGPIRGAVIMGLQLTPSTITDLARVTRLDLTVEHVRPGQSIDQKEVAILDGDRVEGTWVVGGIRGQPVMTLQIIEPRDIYAQGRAASRLMLIALLAVGTVITVITIAAYERVVLRRLTRLSAAVRDVADEPGDERRVPVEGDDELTRLAQDINGMLLAVGEANQELRRTNEQLREADQLKRNLIAMVSHELRTPLTAILGFGQLVQSGWDRLTDEQRRTFIDKMSTKAQALQHIVEQLLVLSRIEAGVLQVHRRPVELHTELVAALDRSGLLAEDVEIDCPPDLRALVDATHLEQMVVNYLTNAFRYGRPPVRVVARADGDAVEVRVIDVGDGVPGEFVPQLFEAFTQASVGTHRPARGMGLGLSIVAMLAGVNGGTAWYEAADGGACFGVRLEMAAAEAAMNEAALVGALADRSH